jgi:DNA-binding PadR family transcriptional regulator
MGTPARSTVNLAVLSVVLEMPGHGYDIGTRFVGRYGGLFNSTVPHVYKVLDLLEQKQLVEGSAHPDVALQGLKPSMRQPKRFYRVSPGGARVCRGWLTGPIPSHDARRELWIRLRSTRPRDFDTILQLLDHFEYAVLATAGHVAESPENPVSVVDTLAREDRETMVEAELRWLASARDHVRAAARATGLS